tara:strand:+ start:379 stop:534 length:156 start_codon:yes stop_codon:yes gene_type:complete
LCNVYPRKQHNNVDSEKVTAEKLNGYEALFGCIALVGALQKQVKLFLALFN